MEATNNEAERALHRAVIWRKTSFGTQSERGDRFCERVLSVQETLRRGGRSLFDHLVQALTAARLGQPVSSTLPP